jgi:hydrogenase maturation protease
MAYHSNTPLLTMKTIVIGLGNPILGDDGVGWKVVEEVEKQLPIPSPRNPLSGEEQSHAIDVECLSLGGISLMEHLIGYERAILIDAFSLDVPTGSILVLKLSELPNYSAFHTASAHDTSLENAIKLGRSMGAQLPEDIAVVGIVTRTIHDFGEDLSPPVAQAVPQAVQIVLDLLEQKVINQ